MNCKLKKTLFSWLVVSSLIAPLWLLAAHAQQPPSPMHEEREDRRQVDVVHNMHFADDVLKSKFLEIYVPYQERLFKIEHGYRDLIKDYLNAQANDQVIPGPQARKLLERGLRLQRERLANLDGYIGQLKEKLPGGVALQAWILENKLHAASASYYLNDVPFVTQ